MKCNSKETDDKQEPALAVPGRRSRKLRRGINLYPPYLGAAVRVTHIADDFRRIKVEMPLRFYNRSYLGTAFRRIAILQCDPFYVLMLINILGPDYIVYKPPTSASGSPARA